MYVVLCTGTIFECMIICLAFQGESLKGDIEQLSMELDELTERFKETAYQV